MRLTDEVRVGMIASLGILMLVAFLIFVSNRTVGQRGHVHDVVFGNVSGLQEGAEVQMAGVVIGMVESVGLTEDFKARVRMRLDPEVVLPPDPVFTVNIPPMLGETIVEVAPESPLLRAGDLRHPDQFMGELRRSNRAFARHLRSQLSLNTRKALDAHVEGAEVSKALRDGVLADLNRLLRGRSLYDEGAFADVPLSKEARQLLEQNPSGAELIRLNRLLLEDAFPKALKKRGRHLVAALPEDTYRGQDPVTLEQLVPKLAEMMETVQAIATDVRGMLSDPLLAQALQQTVTNVAAITENVSQLVADPRLAEGIYGSLKSAQAVTDQAALIAGDVRKVTQDLGGINRILENTEGITADMREQVRATMPKFDEIVTDLSDTVDAIRWLAEDSGVLKEQVPALMESGKRAVQNIEKTTANLETLTGDPALQGDLKASLTAVKEVLENVKGATESLRDLAADPELHADLRETISSARVTMEHAENVSEKVDNALGSTGDSLAKLGRFKWRTNVAYHYLPENNRFFGDLNFDVWPSEKNFFRIGIHDFAENDRIQLQAGSFLSDDRILRFGLLRAKLGAGLDYRLGPRYSVSADLYDPNELKLNLWGRYHFNDEWTALLGVEEIGRETRYGLGVQFTP